MPKPEKTLFDQLVEQLDVALGTIEDLEHGYPDRELFEPLSETKARIRRVLEAAGVEVESNYND